jgi:hypothetical protein
MKIKHYPLNSKVTDSATGLSGSLVHLSIELGNVRFYNFQPRGLNPEDGQPVARFWVMPERIQNPPGEIETELPVEAIGTEVTDDASGFTGKAISLTLHPSGCVHIVVQPAGKLAKTGAKVEACDFDIRRVSGPAIPVLTPAARAESEYRNPSPSHCDRTGPRSL